eukprot:scaffold2092_cov137-Isochrysis_galbana.AAC.4
MASSRPSSDAQHSAQYEKRVSTSPHSSPANEPSGRCSEATYRMTRSSSMVSSASKRARICTADSVYSMCASCPRLPAKPPQPCWHDRTNDTTYVASSALRLSIRWSAQAPQYTPDSRRCSDT